MQETKISDKLLDLAWTIADAIAYPARLMTSVIGTLLIGAFLIGILKCPAVIILPILGMLSLLSAVCVFVLRGDDNPDPQSVWSAISRTVFGIAYIIGGIIMLFIR